MQKTRQMPYPLRMPLDLREFLQKSADEIGRSLHVEIIRRLEQSRKQEQQNAK